MASLTEHVMINKLGDDLDEAITFVGGDTSSVTNIMQYPQIIKDQLNSENTSLKEIILEGDSSIIIADETGRDEYNTSYASGVKTGLNPGAYYIRICTAVKDIEPVYIDLTPVTDLIQSGGEVVNIDTIVKKVIESPEIKDAINKEVQSHLEDINNRLAVLENKEHLTTDDVQDLINSSLTNYVTKDELNDIEPSVTEERVIEIVDEKFNQVNISQTTIENITNDITSINQSLETKVDQSVVENITNDITSINQTLETKVDQSVVEQIVIEKLESNTNNDGIDVDELNW